MSAPDGRCTATGWEGGCAAVPAGDGAPPDRSRCRVLDGAGGGRARRGGPPGAVVPGAGGRSLAAVLRREQQDPAGVDQAGVGEGAAVGLWLAFVEAEQFVPVIAVAEEPGGDGP